MSRIDQNCHCQCRVPLPQTETLAPADQAWVGTSDPQAPPPRTVAESHWPLGSASPEVDGRNCFTLVSLPGLDFSKVTCLLGWVGLGDNVYLFTELPLWTAVG